MTKLMLRDFKNELSFFNKESCLFFVERKVIEIDVTRDADEIMKTTKTILESSFFSSEFVFLMIKSLIVKSFLMRLFFDELMKIFFDEVRFFRRLEFFFAFVVTLMTKAINFSAYLFNQSFDQFIEI
jgi:hypothetical protein